MTSSCHHRCPCGWCYHYFISVITFIIITIIIRRGKSKYGQKRGKQETCDRRHLQPLPPTHTPSVLAVGDQRLGHRYRCSQGTQSPQNVSSSGQLRSRTEWFKHEVLCLSLCLSLVNIVIECHSCHLMMSLTLSVGNVKFLSLSLNVKVLNMTDKCFHCYRLESQQTCQHTSHNSQTFPPVLWHVTWCLPL